jgi:hypothetical protein
MALVIVLVVLLAMPHRAHGGEIVSLNIDTAELWTNFDQGWQAYQRDDWGEAFRLLGMVFPLYIQLRGNPRSPFPQDPQFLETFRAALQHVQGELRFWVHQFPEQSRREYADLGMQLSQCRFQLTGSDRAYTFVLPGMTRPPKPVLSRLPPPRN